MKIFKRIYLIGLLTITMSCKQQTGKDQNEAPLVRNEEQTIKIRAQQEPFGDTSEFEMRVQKALETLEYADPSEVELDSSDLIIGIALKDKQIAIPLKYMSAYEVANFIIDSESISITWCPLVGTARVFESGNENPGFDFGRALKNNNLIFVDRKTNTVWNQLSGKAIQGKLEGDNLSPLPTIQSTWNFWKRKYPETRLLINRDTTNAVFPNFIDEKPYYYNWQPGDGRPNFTNNHEAQVLGLGIDFGSSSIYFPFTYLFKKKSPLQYEINDRMFNVHFSEEGLTAWVEDNKGNMIPSSLAYEWAWKAFYPDTKIFRE